jgi:hypothetical protein
MVFTGTAPRWAKSWGAASKGIPGQRRSLILWPAASDPLASAVAHDASDPVHSEYSVRNLDPSRSGFLTNGVAGQIS